MARPKGPEKAKYLISFLLETDERLKKRAEADDFNTVSAWIANYFESGKDEAPKQPRDQETNHVAIQQPTTERVVHRVNEYPVRDITPRFKKGMGG